MNGRVIATPEWAGAHGEGTEPRMGFFTDTSVCIGCKACEVACNCLLYTSDAADE